MEVESAWPGEGSPGEKTAQKGLTFFLEMLPGVENQRGLLNGVPLIQNGAWGLQRVILEEIQAPFCFCF